MPFDQGGIPGPSRVGVFGATDLVRLEGAEAVHATPFRPDHDRIVRSGGLVGEVEACDMAIVCLPRNRIAGLALVAEACQTLSPEGVLIVDGQKTDGIDAALKKLRAVLPLTGSAAKAHGKIAWFTRPDPLPPALESWTAAARPKRTADGYLTAAGVFSSDGLDPATSMLIEHLPQDAKGTAADFGAGWGALAGALLTASPALESVDLVEADSLALDLARQNVTDPRAAFHWADATQWGGGPYDLIVSNPPFHVARQADPSLGQAFLVAAAARLRTKGRLMVVANRQLPYEATLEATFHNWQVLTSTLHYKILTATRPRTTRRG